MLALLLLLLLLLLMLLLPHFSITGYPKGFIG